MLDKHKIFFKGHLVLTLASNVKTNRDIFQIFAALLRQHTAWFLMRILLPFIFLKLYNFLNLGLQMALKWPGPVVMDMSYLLMLSKKGTVYILGQ